MNTQPVEPMQTPSTIQLDRVVKVRYKNWRGEVAVRTIVPVEVFWGKTDWHPGEQWLLKVWDIERNAERVYAFADIQEFGVE